ncbi:hypothetical protein I9W82_000179 [Candida metapsilosis]|uniref:Uncharacterized protein n=1 Tax=Candida metapsilosis TaxID=273372 RepID=A0A8H7ZIB7_9ASCO|nr:hypothetical protein I9W82_000179 [Candida metapsilosis]
MDLIVPSKVEETKKDAKIRSGDEDEIDTSSQSSQLKSPLNTTTTKSFGVRRIEILQMQLDGTIRGKLQIHATSSYQKHSLFSTINIIQSVISAAAQPCYARLSDRFGRLEVCLFAIVFYSMGTVMQSQAYDVNRFAGGSVIYQIGYTGIIILLQIILADFSNLNWRLLCSFIPAMPLIITTWIGGDIVASVLTHYSWSWGIGMWAFIFPLSAVPLLGCFIHMHIKARKTPEWQAMMKEFKSQRQYPKTSFAYWRTLAIDLFWSLDSHSHLVEGSAPNGQMLQQWFLWLLVLSLFQFFVIWEAKYARSPIMPLQLMKDRGVWSALLIAILLNWIWQMPNDFVYTILLVVGMNASIKAATRIASLYSFVPTIVGPLLGLVVARVRRLKGFIILGCICWAVSLGILYRFRGDNDGIESEKYLNGVHWWLVFDGI